MSAGPSPGDIGSGGEVNLGFSIDYSGGGGVSGGTVGTGSIGEVAGGRTGPGQTTQTGQPVIDEGDPGPPEGARSDPTIGDGGGGRGPSGQLDFSIGRGRGRPGGRLGPQAIREDLQEAAREGTLRSASAREQEQERAEEGYELSEEARDSQETRAIAEAMRRSEGRELPRRPDSQAGTRVERLGPGAYRVNLANVTGGRDSVTVGVTPAGVETARGYQVASLRSDIAQSLESGYGYGATVAPSEIRVSREGDRYVAEPTESAKRELARSRAVEGLDRQAPETQIGRNDVLFSGGRARLREDVAGQTVRGNITRDYVQTAEASAATQAYMDAIQQTKTSLGMPGWEVGEEFNVNYETVSSADAGRAAVATSVANAFLPGPGVESPVEAGQGYYDVELTPQGRRQYVRTEAVTDLVTQEDAARMEAAAATGGLFSPAASAISQPFEAGERYNVEDPHMGGTPIKDLDQIKFDEEGFVTEVEQPDTAIEWAIGPPGKLERDIGGAVAGGYEKVVGPPGDIERGARTLTGYNPIFAYNRAALGVLGDAAGEVEGRSQFILGPPGGFERDLGGTAYWVAGGSADWSAWATRSTADLVGDYEEVMHRTWNAAVPGGEPDEWEQVGRSIGDIARSPENEKSETTFRESFGEKVAGGAGGVGFGLTIGLPNVAVQGGEITGSTAEFTADQISDKGFTGGSLAAGTAGAIAARGLLSSMAEEMVRHPYRSGGSIAGGYLLGPVAGRAGRAARGRVRTIGGQRIDPDEMIPEKVQSGEQRFPYAEDPDLYRRDPAEAVRQQAPKHTPGVVDEYFEGQGYSKGTTLTKALGDEPEGPGRGRAGQGFKSTPDETGIDPGAITPKMVQSFQDSPGPFAYESPGSFWSTGLSQHFLRQGAGERGYSLIPGLPSLGGKPTVVMGRTQVRQADADTDVEFAKEMAEREGDPTAYTKPPREVNPSEIEAVVPPGATYSSITTGVRRLGERLGIGSRFYTEVQGTRVPIRLAAPEGDVDTGMVDDVVEQVQREALDYDDFGYYAGRGGPDRPLPTLPVGSSTGGASSVGRGVGQSYRGGDGTASRRQTARQGDGEPTEYTETGRRITDDTRQRTTSDLEERQRRGDDGYYRRRRDSESTPRRPGGGSRTGSTVPDSRPVASSTSRPVSEAPSAVGASRGGSMAESRGPGYGGGSSVGGGGGPSYPGVPGYNVPGSPVDTPTTYVPYSPYIYDPFVPGGGTPGSRLLFDEDDDNEFGIPAEEWDRYWVNPVADAEEAVGRVLEGRSPGVIGAEEGDWLRSVREDLEDWR